MFVVYDIASGKICLVGKFDIELNVAEGQDFIEINDNEDFIDKMVVDGALVDEPPPDKTWGQIRFERTALLYASDWTILEDSPLTPSEKAPVIEYRTQLRDITTAFASADLVVFPDRPSVLGAG